MKKIEINRLTKDYGKGKGVFDLSFSVEEGEVMGFLGPNGAGKTTTIRNLLGFIKPDSGNVYINGLDCFTKGHKIKRNLGYLPGEIAFIDEMKGLAFIKFIGKMNKISNMSKAEELIDYFEVDVSGKIKKMSKGMKQKIALVCAFMGNSEILILDEPSSGLDPLMQNKLVELVLKEKQKGTTVLLSSHVFEEVERTCDKAIIIKSGRMVGIEDIQTLRQNKKKVFEVRFSTVEEANAFANVMQVDSVYENRIIITLEGGIDNFIKNLGDYSIQDLLAHSQTLEELFLHFYGGDTHV